MTHAGKKMEMECVNLDWERASSFSSQSLNFSIPLVYMEKHTSTANDWNLTESHGVTRLNMCSLIVIILRQNDKKRYKYRASPAFQSFEQ